MNSVRRSGPQSHQEPLSSYILDASLHFHHSTIFTLGTHCNELKSTPIDDGKAKVTTPTRETRFEQGEPARTGLALPSF
jgi:hypothetical protein